MRARESCGNALSSPSRKGVQKSASRLDFVQTAVQKGALSATGQLRVAELVKLFAVEEEA